MVIKFDTVGDAISLLGDFTQIMVEYAVNDVEDPGCVFLGIVQNVPYWVTRLKLDTFSATRRAPFRLVDGIGIVDDNGVEDGCVIGILCKKPNPTELCK